MTPLFRLFVVAAFLLLLGSGVVGKAATSTTRNGSLASNAQLTFYATNNLGYLEFLDLANQSGDIILTQAQSLLLNVSQTYIILFVPYNATTEFQSWTVEGNATLSDNQYLTNMTLYGNATLTAIATNPVIPVPEFPSGYLVVLILAFAVIAVMLDGRKVSFSAEAHRPTARGYARLR